MADGNSVSREHESCGSASVIRGSKTVRVNLDPHTLASWPFRFTVIDDSTAVTVPAVFVSLFMGRLQWARALKPTTSIAIDDDGAQFQPDSDKWRAWIYNAGPGEAVI